MPFICRRGEDKMPAVGFLVLLLFLLLLSLLWEEKLPPLTSLHYRENQGKSWFSVFLLPDIPISYFSWHLHIYKGKDFARIKSSSPREMALRKHWRAKVSERPPQLKCPLHKWPPVHRNDFVTSCFKHQALGRVRTICQLTKGVKAEYFFEKHLVLT